MSEQMNFEVIVMDRGFVLVGRNPRPDPDDELNLILDDCSIVRTWGTSEGLGQLAREGPLEKTILDSEGDGVKINRIHIYRRIKCSEAWVQWKISASPKAVGHGK